MSKFSDNPDRKRFIKVEGFDNWQCMDYKTFYMNVRRQDQHIDECHKRDKNKYIPVSYTHLTLPTILLV